MMQKLYAYTTYNPLRLNFALALAAYLHEEFQNLAELHVCQITGDRYFVFIVSENFLSKKLLSEVNDYIRYFHFNIPYNAPFNSKFA